MKRVIILTYDYPPNNGGIARLCFEIKKQCKLNGLSVRVVTLASSGTDMENDEDVIRIVGKRGLLEWRILNYLKKNTERDDIILTGTFHPDGLLGWLSGRKVYMLAHGAELLPGKSFFQKYVWTYYRKYLFKSASGVIANSHYTERLVRLCSPLSKVYTIPLAVDYDYFRPTSSKMRDGVLHLCSLSRLEKFKGHDFLIRVISSLPSKYKEKISLTIGGNGPYKESLVALTRELRLEDTIGFEGFIDDGKLCDFYSSADIFVLCTREELGLKNVEGFGLVFVEAQACGTAVIGTRAGGIPDAVKDGYGGWLITQDSQKELSELLMFLIDHPEIVAEEGLKARQRAIQEYSWQNYYKALSGIICR